MRRLAMLLAVVACVGLVGSLALSQEKPKETPRETPKEKPKAGLPEQYAQLVKVLNLSPEVVQKITAAVDAARQANKDWEAANGEKVKAARAVLEEARKNKDEAAAKTAQEGLKAIEATREDIRKKLDTDVLALLTPEQKAKWYETLALEAIQREFKAANLTEEQLGKIKAAYVTATTGVNLDDPKARQQAFRGLGETVKTNILTEEQRAALKEKRTEGRPPGKEGGKEGVKEGSKEGVVKEGVKEVK